jgi:hypothetical protein
MQQLLPANVVAAVKADKTKALDMFNKERVSGGGKESCP